MLYARGLMTPDELRASVEAVDAWGAKAEGPRIVARAWCDPEFKARLLLDSTSALPSLQIPTSNYGYIFLAYHVFSIITNLFCF